MRNIGEGSVPPGRRQQLQRLLKRNDPLVMQLVAARKRVQRATMERNRLQARANAVATEISSLDQRINANQAEIARLRPFALELAQARDAASARLLGRPDINGPISTGLPLLLLPVRLETRFMAKDAGAELWLRVYPDDIHVTDHEPLLTEMERQWGENYWNHLKDSGENGDIARRAWQQLQAQFGPRRGTWVARATRPGGTLATPGPRVSNGTPHTDVLPDRLVAVGFVDERVVFTAWGQSIPEVLSAGLNPEGEAIDPAAGLPPVDPGMRWMIDFDEAVSQGMALRIPLSAELASRGLDRLLVLGLKASAEAESAAERLQALLQSHQYTGGLRLLEMGVPTNNTESQASAFRSGAGADLPVLDRDPAPVQKQSQGGRMARALGLPQETFAALDGADELADDHSRMMQRLLWDVLSAPMKGQLLTEGVDGAALGQHFAEFVRAMGPLASLQVGSQPYGMLPVTSVMRWDTSDSAASGRLAAWWRDNRARWRACAASARAFDDPTGALAPLEHGAGSRQDVLLAKDQMAGEPNQTSGLQAFLQGLVKHALAAADGDTRAALEALPQASQLRLAADALDTLAYRADAWATSLATSRLAELRQRQAQGLCIGAYGWLEHVRPAPPLILLSSGDAPVWKAPGNHGHFQAPSLAHAAAASLLRSGFVDEEFGPQSGSNPFAVDLSSARVRRSLWLLDAVRQGQSLSSLLSYRFERILHEQGLDIYIERFRRLLALSSGSKLNGLLTQLQAIEHDLRGLRGLERDAAALAQEKLDAESVFKQLDAGRGLHQAVIDAITAMPARVQALQNEAIHTQQQATRLGEPQTPSSTQAGRVRILEPVDVEAQLQQRLTLEEQASGNQLEAATLNERYHAAAPSLEQARQALAQLQDSSRPGSPAALRLRITALERDLDDVRVQIAAKNVLKILSRKEALLAQLSTQIHQLWDEAGEVSLGRISDGLELRHRWQLAHAKGDGQPDWSVATIPFGAPVLGFPAPNTADFAKLTAALAVLDDLVDGVGDVMTAESVYQIVQGNPLRSGASLDAIATGEVPPPELEMVRTPRTGAAITHRFACLMPTPDAGAVARWPGRENPRVRAEPRLNAWLAQHLPDPAHVICQVHYQIDQTVQAGRSVSLMELGLSPLDCLYLADGSGQAQQSELEQRLAELAMRSRPAEIPADATIELAFGRDDNWPLERRSFAELLEMLRALRLLVLSARPVLTQDLTSTGAVSTAENLDLAELRQRVTIAIQTLKDRRDTLHGLLVSQTPAPGELRAALLAVAELGAVGAIPTEPADNPAGLAKLRADGEAVVRQLDARLQALAQTGPASDADLNLAFQAEAARLNLVFGAELRVLPVVTSKDGGLQASFGASIDLQDGDALAASHWARRVAKVREGMARWSTVQLYGETLGLAADLRVGQLPHAPGERWIALPFKGAMPQGRLSFVAHSPSADPIRLEAGIAGLLVDEWNEVIPFQTEQTGLGFHFDQPNSAPPNSLLLAVPGDNRPAWDLDSLITILNETLDLAKIRTSPADGAREEVWMQDSLPPGARAMSSNEAWSWAYRDPIPPTTGAAHQSTLVAGMHQHFFDRAKEPFYPAAEDRLFVYVYLDPKHPPRQVMVQWHCTDTPGEVDWEHRAYWGEDLIEMGANGTPSRKPLGPLPPVGRWCRLEVPATVVAVAGHPIDGIAFTLFDGRASWGAAGRLIAPGKAQSDTWVSYEAAAAGG